MEILIYWSNHAHSFETKLVEAKPDRLPRYDRRLRKEEVIFQVSMEENQVRYRFLLIQNLISILASLFEGVPRPQSGFLIEAPNLGQDYYKKLFFGKDHTNYICEGRFLEYKRVMKSHFWPKRGELGFFLETLKDEKYGPICISLKREKLDERARKEKSVYIYRIIVRTASLMVLKGSILEELVPLGRNSYVVSQRDVLMHLLPEININNLRKLTPDGSPNLLINLDSKSEQTGLKIGVLLCKAGQSTEEEMYNNQHSTPLFDQERINSPTPYS